MKDKIIHLIYIFILLLLIFYAIYIPYKEEKLRYSLMTRELSMYESGIYTQAYIGNGKVIIIEHPLCELARARKRAYCKIK